MDEVVVNGDDSPLLSLNLSLSLGIASYRSHESTRKRKRSTILSSDNQNEQRLLELLESRNRSVMFRSEGLDDGQGLRLIRLLLASAAAVDRDDQVSALEYVKDLYRHVSSHGDPIQRVSSYFADGLVARFLTKKSPFYSAIVSNPGIDQEFVAFTEIYRATPYYQFAHFTANQVIIERFEEDKRNDRSLHVIDLDVSYGFQWPSLIQSLSDKAAEDNPIALKITGVGRSFEELKETEMRLTSFAKGCRNLDFDFEGIIRNSSSKLLDDLLQTKKKNETLAVNLVFCLQKLRSSDRDLIDTLMDIKSLNPSAVVVVDKDGSWNPRSFLPTFMDSLHYYAAMFDSLDDCFPTDSAERLRIERNHLGREIKSDIITNYNNIYQKELEKLKGFESWRSVMESSGFKGTKLSSATVSQAKLLLRIKNHTPGIDVGGFRIFEDDGGMEISLNWRDRRLVTASAWRCI